MKFKAVFKDIIPKEVDDKKERALKAFFILITALINNLIPFLLGFYFCLTKNFIFFIATFVLLIFNIRFEYIRGELGIQVKRNV